MFFGRIDLSLGIHKTTDEIGILKIDFVYFILAEMAKLFFVNFVHMVHLQ